MNKLIAILIASCAVSVGAQAGLTLNCASQTDMSVRLDFTGSSGLSFTSDQTLLSPDSGAQGYGVSTFLSTPSVDLLADGFTMHNTLSMSAIGPGSLISVSNNFPTVNLHITNSSSSDQTFSYIYSALNSASYATEGVDPAVTGGSTSIVSQLWINPLNRESSHILGEANLSSSTVGSSDQLAVHSGGTLTFLVRANSTLDLGTTDYQIGLARTAGAVTPEPASLAVLGIGGLALLRRRRKA